MLLRFTYLVLTGGLGLLLGACSGEGGAGHAKGDSLNIAPIPMRPKQVDKEVPLPAPEYDTLGVGDFRAAFKEKTRRPRYAIGPNFSMQELPGLKAFGHVFIRLPDGKVNFLRMSEFYAWSFSENTEGKYEMVTVKPTEGGYIVYLSAFDKEFNLLGSMELARRHEADGMRTAKWGEFSDAQNYHYTYTLHLNGELQDSMGGNLFLPASGKYHLIGEGSLR